MRGEMGQLIGSTGIDFTDWAGLVPAYPPINLLEDDDHLFLETELPGLMLASIEITVVDNNRLMIKGKRDSTAPKESQWHRQERPFGSFERTILLPFKVDPARVEAHLEQGVLRVTMTKTADAKPRRIVVKAE